MWQTTYGFMEHPESLTVYMLVVLRLPWPLLPRSGLTFAQAYHSKILRIGATRLKQGLLRDAP
jgi:hypothetical protein